REQRDRNYQPLDVNKLIQESIIFSANKLKVSTQLKGKKVHLHSNLDKDLITKGNPVELKEVFTNLLLNAYDAMPNGGDLYISGSKTSDGNIQIVIRDTGTGMSEEIKNKIFNPFFTTKGEKGTGLGLSIVYNTITAHGGHIKLDSELNKGSTFTILLPSTKEEIDQKSAPIEQLQENFGRLRLLIVDDEPELLDTMAEILRLKFQSVEIADSGQSALKKIGSARFDVVLTDLGMPEMSGWELAEKVKEKSPKSHVILVTGWGDQAREELKHHPHVDEILAKPYDLNDLINKINKISQN
ncbi:MAG TPA: response regulator, partial [Caldithrix sp.]|nr:response regulator [Caldithrix sp.]